MDKSNPNSKKRKLGEISNTVNEDRDILFGRSGNNGNEDEKGHDVNYRGGSGAAYNDDEGEALEDNNEVIEGDDEEAQGSDEGEGDDLLENMEA